MSDSTPQADAREARNHLIEEINITQGTRPYVKIYLKGRPPSKKVLKHFYDEGANFQNGIDSEYPGAFIAKYGRDIIGIEFEGAASGARTGTININDPLGVWPEIMGHVSEFTNGSGIGSANLKIEYGWEDLRNAGDEIKVVYGLMRETNFEVDENGLMKLSIKFWEGSVNRIKGLKFLRLEDMWETDPSTHNEEHHKQTVDELLEFIIENTSISEQLKRNRIVMTFEACNSEDTLRLGNYSIRFGDSFYDLLNNIISNAVPPKDIEPEDYNWAYTVRSRTEEIGPDDEIEAHGQNYEVEEGDIITYIEYKWIGAPDNDDDEMDFRQTHNAVYIGNIVWKNDYLARGTAEGESDFDSSHSQAYDKTALSLSLDMKPFSILHSLISSELHNVLEQFDDSTWDRLKDRISDAMEEGDDLDTIMAEGESFLGIWDTESREEVAERQRLYDELSNFQISDDDEESNNPNSSPVERQLKAFIKQYPFMATVDILGDPYIGSDIQMGVGYFVLFFDTPTEFTQYLNGLQWLVMKATHKIDSEGLYKTTLELQANTQNNEGEEEPGELVENEMELTGILGEDE